MKPKGQMKLNCELFRKWRFVIAFSCAVLLLGQEKSYAFNQPPSNLGTTSFLDGAAPPPGLYYVHYGVFTDGREAKDNNGDKIPGGAKVAAFADLHQFSYLTNWSVLGGNFLAMTIIPVTAVTTKGSLGLLPLSNNTAGLGDVLVGAGVQWYNKKLFGRPYFSRLELDLVLPTGRYDNAYLANPGANILTIEPFYAATWFFSQYWETSWRFTYHMNGKNDDFVGGPLGMGLEPGDTFSFNYTFSRSITPKWRLGVVGYYLQQLQEDKIGSQTMTDSKESVFGVGPGLAFVNPESGTAIMFNHVVDTTVKNRFAGSKTNLQLVIKLGL